MHVCVYVCMHVCMYAYIHIYIYIRNVIETFPAFNQVTACATHIHWRKMCFGVGFKAQEHREVEFVGFGLSVQCARFPKHCPTLLQKKTYKIELQTELLVKTLL